MDDDAWLDAGENKPEADGLYQVLVEILFPEIMIMPLFQTRTVLTAIARFADGAWLTTSPLHRVLAYNPARLLEVPR